MIKIQCDMCGKGVKDTFGISELYEQYRTNEVKDVCRECSNMINDHLFKLKAVESKLISLTMKEWISNKLKALGS